MELYQLRSFAVVADEGHLTRAAKRLNTSQPTVSAHIKALEDEFGLVLFERTPKGMVLTREGTDILNYAEKILLSCGELKNRARELNETLLGNLKIGLNSDPEFLKTGELFILFSHKNPSINLNLYQSISGKILLDIKSGVLDGGYFFGKNDNDDVETYVIRDLKLVVVGPFSWKERFEYARIEELAKFPWIGNPQYCPFNFVFHDLFEKNNLKAPISLVAEHESTIKSLVSAGAGMSFMLEHEALPAAEKGELAIWKQKQIEWQLSFAHLKKRENDPLIRTLNAAIREIWNER